MYKKTMKFTAAICFSILAFADFSHGQVCQPAPVNLVSWYAADGNALDSRSRNNGNLQNGATFAAGQNGQAFNLDGVNDFVKVNASPSLDVGTGNGFTIEAWINPVNSFSMPIVEYDSATEIGAHFFKTTGADHNLFANLIDTSGNNHIIQSPAGVVAVVRLRTLL